MLTKTPLPSSPLLRFSASPRQSPTPSQRPKINPVPSPLAPSLLSSLAFPTRPEQDRRGRFHVGSMSVCVGLVSVRRPGPDTPTPAPPAPVTPYAFPTPPTPQEYFFPATQTSRNVPL